MTTFESTLRQILSVGAARLPVGVGRSVIAPGSQEAWDDCCDGQIHLKIRSIDPLPSKGSGCVATPWRVSAALGVIRCVTALTNEGRAPSSEQVTSDALKIMRDTDALWQSLVQEISRLETIQGLTVDSWLPLGAQGGCAGGEWRFRFLWLGTGPCEGS